MKTKSAFFVVFIWLVTNVSFAAMANNKTPDSPEKSAYNLLLKSLKRKSNSAEGLPADPQHPQQIDPLFKQSLEALSAYRVSETADLLIYLLKDETESYVGRFGSINKKSESGILYLLDQLKSFAPANYALRALQVLRPLEEILRYVTFTDPSQMVKMTSALEDFLHVTKHREAPLPSFRDLDQLLVEKNLHLLAVDFQLEVEPSTDSKSEKALNRYRRALEYFQLRIKGQPELVQAMADLIYKQSVFGENKAKSKKPPKLFLMGAPGVGKDTAVHALVDFLANEREGSWQDSRFLYQMPVLKKNADLWKIMGSNTGYIGSDSLPTLLKYLVEHSSGRYKIENHTDATGRKSFSVVEHPDYEEGEVTPGYQPADHAVIFCNEFHNWPKEMKDLIKQSVETGRWEINNPNGGLSEIYVPAIFVFATNEGTALIGSRETNGARFGRPLTFEQRLKKWELAKGSPQRLRSELMRSNLEVSRQPDSGPIGYSEEFLNRIEDSSLLLLRPLSEAHVRDIITLKLSELAKKLDSDGNNAGRLQLTWTPRLVEFVQQFQFESEDGARPADDKIAKLIERTLLDALLEKKIPFDQGVPKVGLDVELHPDKTASLKIMSRNQAGEILAQGSMLIRATLAEKEKEPIDQVQIEKLLKLKEFLRSRIFGMSDTLFERIAKTVLLAEEATNNKSENSKAGAKLMAFFGLSSSGKTETTSAIAEYLYGSPEERVVIDFSQVQTVQDVKNLILGNLDASGRPVASKFMKHFDRSNGQRLLFVFDEIANTPKPVLRALYDIFRERQITTFVDGQTRDMQSVMIALTGNVGEEWYQEIPRDLPDLVQIYAMHQAYRLGVSNPGAVRSLLEKYFTEALINRIGLQNIHFFPPASFQSARELSQLKLMQAIKHLEPSEGRWGWNLAFQNEKIFEKMLELIEVHGFVVREQGASIDRFVSGELEGEIRSLLLKNQVTRGTQVIVEDIRHLTSDSKQKFNADEVFEIVLSSENKKNLSFRVHLKSKIKARRTRPEDLFLTGIHEAGHQVVREVLLGELYRPTRLSIIPGFTHINSQGVYYRGLAESEPTRDSKITRANVIYEMSVLVAGYLAQSMATKGRLHDAGKSNDLERATALAYQAILKFGLSPKWGTLSVPSGMETKVFIEGLSDQKRALLYDEVDSMIKEASHLAENILLLNMDQVVLPLAKLVSEKGELGEKDFKEFYQHHQVLPLQLSPSGKPQIPPSQMRWVVGQKALSPLEAQLLDWIQLPSTLATLDEVVEKDRRQQIAKVQKPIGLRLIEGVSQESPQQRPRAMQTAICSSLLESEKN